MAITAFLSYQTGDREVARELKGLLAPSGVDAFLAHEDIEVSYEWRRTLLRELARANIFICLLSKRYLESPWCMQESGIAASRTDVTIVPLSLDSTLPPGFLSAYQAISLSPGQVALADLLPLFFAHDFNLGVEMTTRIIAGSKSFRGAEENFQLMLPYLTRLSDGQVKALLQCAADNDQIHHASLCAREYLPPLVKSHGKFLAPKTRSKLNKVLQLYRRDA